MDGLGHVRHDAVVGVQGIPVVPRAHADLTEAPLGTSSTGSGIKSLTLNLEGNIDLQTFLGLAESNAGFEAIRVKVHLDADATPEAIRKLHEKVVKTSPVGHTLSRAVPLNVELA